MKRVKKLFVARRADERGATFIFTAICMVVLLGASAMGVDVGFSVYGSRQAQAMADTAALDLARYISYADTLGSLTAVQNYFDTKKLTVDADNGSNAQLNVTAGYYANGTFKAGGINGTSCQPTRAPLVLPGCNAIEVTANQSVPQIFFGGFNVLKGHAGNSVSSSVSGSSIATVTPQAGFSIGSYLASLNTQQSAVLNAVLGSMGSASVTAVGYQGLATSYVTLAQLISANSSTLSASNIMTANLTAGQWLTAWLNVVGTQYGVSSTAYTALQALNFSGGASTQVKLCQLLNVNTSSTQFNCSNSTISPQGLNASINVLQMLTTEAELANGASGIDVGSALHLTVAGLNIGNVKLSLQVIQPAQVAYGPVGTTAKTAQVSSNLSMNLSIPILGTQLGTLSIPLSAASGTATLSTLSCVDNSLSSASIGATTQALSTSVTLTLLGVATTEGSLSVSGVSGPSGSVTYSGSVVPPSTATETATPPTNPVTVGTSSPTLGFTPSGVINALVSPLMSVLASAYGPVLQAVGVQVAGAQIADLSTNCGAVSLVQ